MADSAGKDQNSGISSSGPLAAQNLDDTRKAMMVELRNRTGLNETYTLLCLEETGWDLNAALAAFESAKVGHRGGSWVRMYPYHVIHLNGAYFVLLCSMLDIHSPRGISSLG